MICLNDKTLSKHLRRPPQSIFNKFLAFFEKEPVLRSELKGVRWLRSRRNEVRLTGSQQILPEDHCCLLSMNSLNKTKIHNIEQRTKCDKEEFDKKCLQCESEIHCGINDLSMHCQHIFFMNTIKFNQLDSSSCRS